MARPGPGAPVAGLAGDGGVLAYALRGGTVGLVSSDEDDWYGEALSHSAVPVTGISVDSDRVATLYRDGTVTVLTEGGHTLSSFAAGPARAIALQGNAVAVLRSGHLDLYNAETGVLTHSWHVPADARSVGFTTGSR